MPARIARVFENGFAAQLDFSLDMRRELNEPVTSDVMQCENLTEERSEWRLAYRF